MNRHALIAFGAVVLLAAISAYLLSSLERPAANTAGAIKVVAPSRTSAPSNEVTQTVVPAQLLEEYGKPEDPVPPPPPPPPSKPEGLINPVFRYTVPDSKP